MDIQSLRVRYEGQLLITDIDDCLIKTTKAIEAKGLKKKNFWLNKEIYERYKKEVLYTSELTSWGLEFFEGIKQGLIKNFKLLTSGRERKDLIISRFNLPSECLMEGYSLENKIKYLNDLTIPAIYVDDKTNINVLVLNEKVKVIHYQGKEPFEREKTRYKRPKLRKIRRK